MSKSLMARLTAFYLKHFWRKPSSSQMRSQLEKMKDTQEPEYRIDRRYHFKNNIKTYSMGNMKYYVLNEHSESKKTVIYIHGGAYVSQILSFHWKFISKLAEATGYRVVVPIYPLIPYGNYKIVYRLLTELYKKFIKDDVILMGDSAGGALCLGLYLYWHKLEYSLPYRVVAFSPWVDIALKNPEIENYRKKDPFLNIPRLMVCAEYWADGTEYKDFRLSPLFGDTSCLRNVTVFTGTDEILYPDLQDFYSLIELNPGCKMIVGEGMNHVYPLFPIPEAKKAFKQVLEAIK
ncbi:MAG: alpha/beta hydrolase [Ruminococcus sp.]|nr:alpha/beta hydrolase [Ruminococcus sp.]